MINIKRINVKNFEDCHQYKYDICDGQNHLYFYQAGSGDLMMILYSNNCNVVKITRKDNLLYKQIKKLYSNITNMRIYKEYMRESHYCKETMEVYKRDLATLYDGKNIIWKSDAPIEDNTELYNYLTITKKKNEYDLIFTSDMNKKTIVVEFNTSRSRYGIFVCEFWQLLHDLKEITEPNNEINDNSNNKKLVKKLDFNVNSVYELKEKIK